MAKKVLINKKTGIEFQTTDPDAVLKKYPKTFRVKPSTTLAKDIEVKEQEIVSNTSDDKPKEKTKKQPTRSDKKD